MVPGLFEDVSMIGMLQQYASFELPMLLVQHCCNKAQAFIQDRLQKVDEIFPGSSHAAKTLAVHSTQHVETDKVPPATAQSCII